MGRRRASRLSSDILIERSSRVDRGFATAVRYGKSNLIVGRFESGRSEAEIRISFREAKTKREKIEARLGARAGSDQQQSHGNHSELSLSRISPR